MTNLTLSVGGQFTETEHRNISINTTFDLRRIAAAQESPSGASSACGPGLELEGNLGLGEIVAMGLVAVAANQSIAIPTKYDPKPAFGSSLAATSTYVYGTFGTTTDFTVNEGVNGGPNWTLSHFKGPAPSGSLVSFGRVVKDTLIVTFVPYCTRKPLAEPKWSIGLPDCNAGADVIAKALNDALNAGQINNTNQLLFNVQPQVLQ